MINIFKKEFATSYDERLKILNIDRLEIKRTKSDLALCYKIVNNLV